MAKSNEPEIVGQCPICEREMWAGPSIDKHHFVPKCRGGKESEYVHKVCHRKIHSLFTEKELEREYNDPEKVTAHPEMQKFIAFIRKKDPDYYDHSIGHTRKRK